MSERAAALAARFEATNEALIAAVQRLSEADWRATCPGEGWSVGVTAHHVAGYHLPVAQLAQGIAQGAALPEITREQIDAGNAQHAREHANCTRAETLALLRRDGAAAAAIIRGLTDEQLDRTAPLAAFGGAPWSAADVIERILIGHPQAHLASIQQAIGR